MNLCSLRSASIQPNTLRRLRVADLPSSARPLNKLATMGEARGATGCTAGFNQRGHRRRRVAVAAGLATIHAGAERSSEFNSFPHRALSLKRLRLHMQEEVRSTEEAGGSRWTSTFTSPLHMSSCELCFSVYLEQIDIVKLRMILGIYRYCMCIS